jgi:hypothetical protein
VTPSKASPVRKSGPPWFRPVLLSAAVVILAGLAFVALKRHFSGEPSRLDPDKPYTVRLTQTRSIHHAQTIQKRLGRMGIRSFIVSQTDSSGEWYNLYSGQFATDSAAGVLRSDSLLKALPDLAVARLDSSSRLIRRNSIEASVEKRNIASRKPSVRNPVYDVLDKFPDSDMFNINSACVFDTDVKPEHREGIEDVNTDLPRGIGKSFLASISQAFSEVVYYDNLFGDKVTMTIARLKPDSARRHDAAFFSKRILDTGDYAVESMKPLTIRAFRPLEGHRVLLRDKGVDRKYVVLTDPAREYAVFCQSTAKSDDELAAILEQTGRGIGLFDFTEFYNTFYTLPDTAAPGDLFIGFEIERLSRNYAKSKGYKDWAKAYVGHWAANGYFYHVRDGAWSYGIFDILTPEKNARIEKMYEASTDLENVAVYGTQGHFVETRFWTFILSREVNFIIDRYAAMIDARSNLSKEDLIDRANRFQFVPGGYRAVNDSTAVPTKVIPDSSKAV